MNYASELYAHHAEEREIARERRSEQLMDGIRERAEAICADLAAIVYEDLPALNADEATGLALALNDYTGCQSVLVDRWAATLKRAV